MSEGGLPIPPLIDALVASGRWPTTSSAANRQHEELLVPTERIAAIAANEDQLFLYPPPFQSVADSVARHKANGWSFWFEFGALHELEASQALIIGDFGLGSDAPILLDYRHDHDPRVIKLAWPQSGDGSPPTSSPTWVEIAETFEDFAKRLGLA